jgi:hypothetical protein
VTDAASMLGAISERIGPYTRKGRIEVAGHLIGLTPTQSRRLAYREWKQIPAHVMDRLRHLYTETCEALDERARDMNEGTHAAIAERRRRHEVIDGKGDGGVVEASGCDGGEDRPAEANPTVND